MDGRKVIERGREGERSEKKKKKKKVR